MRVLLVLISSMGILALIDIVLPAFKLSIGTNTWSLVSGSIGTILTAVVAYLGLTKYQIGRKGLDHLLMKVNYDTYKVVFIDTIHD